MQFAVIFGLVLVAYTHAHIILHRDTSGKQSEPESDPQIREKRDNSKTWETEVGNGKVFGTLGEDDRGLYGQGGYKQNIFNDDRGRLTGQAHGTRVIGPYGDSSSLGGQMSYSGRNGNAAVGVNREIGGRTSLQGSGTGEWQVGKNTKFTAKGSVELGRGKPDYGVQLGLEGIF